jgi:hypothetical protein
LVDVAKRGRRVVSVSRLQFAGLGQGGRPATHYELTAFPEVKAVYVIGSPGWAVLMKLVVL